MTSEKPRDDYAALTHSVIEHWNATVKDRPVFLTAVDNLFYEYLAALPPWERQHHNCNACHSFFSRYGGLVVISDEGHTESAIWPAHDAPAPYTAAFRLLLARVRIARVTGPFVSNHSWLGTPKTGHWTHLAVPAGRHGGVHSHDANHRRAEIETNYRMLSEAIGLYGEKTISRAMSVAKHELSRSEKLVGPLEWLATLNKRLVDVPRERMKNILWLTAATSPAALCHVKGSVVGELLRLVANNANVHEIRHAIDGMLNPRTYQRPQTAPTRMQVEEAEKLVVSLGIERSLDRRFARLDEIEKLWVPTPSALPTTSVFAHLKTETKNTILVPRSMTWVKFEREILPNAKRIRAKVPLRGPYCGLTAPVHMDAPPILQWDTEKRRNPYAWYLYVNGSSPDTWNLRDRTEVDITAITLIPPQWYGQTENYGHFGAGIITVLDGCRDISPGYSNALFPEILKSELHPIRRTIEAHSRRMRLSGGLDANANGMLFRAGPEWDLRLVVDTGDVTLNVKLDRWD